MPGLVVGLSRNAGRTLVRRAWPRWRRASISETQCCVCVAGEWNDAALDVLANQSFVVLEKVHKLWADPVNTSAETKIAESCRLVKLRNPETDCYIYTETDWARTWSVNVACGLLGGKP